MAGYIKLPRGWMDHPALSSGAPFTKREAFAWLIEQAAYRERNVDLEGQTVTLSRGSLAHSGRYMAKAWGWTEPRVRRRLERWEAERLIEVTIDAGRRIVTICDYDRNQQTIEGCDAADDAEAMHYRRGSGAREKKEITDNNRIQRTSSSQRATRAHAAVAAGDGPDLVAGVHAPTARERMWRDAPAIVMRLTGLPKGKARTFLGRLVAETRDDCIRVMEILGRAELLHPLVDAPAYLMAAARGGGAREKPAPAFGAAWMAKYRDPGGGAAVAYDLDLQAEEPDVE